MTRDNDKLYCVIDHANKQRDRDGVNPNRAARRQVTCRWPAASKHPASGAVSDVLEKKAAGCESA